MSLGDIARAMQGLTQGVEAERTAMRKRQVEDQRLAQEKAEYDRYTQRTKDIVRQGTAVADSAVTEADVGARTADDRVSQAGLTTRGMTSDVNVAEGTVGSRIRSSEAAAAGAESRVRVAEAIEGDLIAQEGLQTRSAGSKVRRLEGTEGVDIAQSNTEGMRDIQRNKHAMAIGLDRTLNWAEQAEGALSAKQDTRDREDIVTDEMNNVYANNALTRKKAADSARRMAEIQAKLAKARQDSGFDMTEFAKQNVDAILEGGITALEMASIGGDAAKAALPLINMDRDGDGQPDYPGAVTTGVQEIDGQAYLVALDEQGNVVPSQSAPNLPGMNANELAAAYRRRQEQKNGRSSSSTSDTDENGMPVKLSQVDDLDDLSYEQVGRAFGIEPTDANEDGDLDRYTTTVGAVPEDFVDSADTMMPVVQSSVSAYLARESAAGTDVPQARAKVATPELMALNVFGASPTDLERAAAQAKKNAEIRALTEGKDEEGFGEGIAREIPFFGGGDAGRTGEEYLPTDDEIRKEYNRLLLQMMSNAARRGR